jgi:hypothetical protein
MVPPKHGRIPRQIILKPVPSPERAATCNSGSDACYPYLFSFCLIKGKGMICLPIIYPCLLS